MSAGVKDLGREQGVRVLGRERVNVAIGNLEDWVGHNSLERNGKRLFGFRKIRSRTEESDFYSRWGQTDKDVLLQWNFSGRVPYWILVRPASIV